MELGAIWDWDGVVIDSSRQHEKSWELLAEEEERTLPPDHFVRGFGKKNSVIIPNLLGWTEDPLEVRRLSLRKEELYREVIRQPGGEAKLLPGVRLLLRSLQEAGIRSVVGTSTERLNVEIIVRMYALEKLFGGMIASEDVNRGKPDPEVFLQCAELLGLPPFSCVVFEDSLHGIEAGLAGGMKVVAVATTQPMEVLLASGAHLSVESLEDVSIDNLRKLFSYGL